MAKKKAISKPKLSAQISEISVISGKVFDFGFAICQLLKQDIKVQFEPSTVIPEERSKQRVCGI